MQTSVDPQQSRFPLARTALFLALSSCALAATPPKETALDRYVAAPDSHYKYEVIKTTAAKEYTLYTVELTSQQWRTADEVDKPIWKHWLTIVKPNEVVSKTGFLFIDGGSTRDTQPPVGAEIYMISLALATHTVTADLRMIPNEPLTFAGETKPRSEDAIIAYTWDKFLRGGDENWPLRLPMTKAAVRAMDAISDFAHVENFVVSGGSKRGWTTWTTAAVDKRVVAIIPFVIDLLNIVPSFEHHYRAYGFWAPAVKDYVEMGIMDWAGTPRYKQLMDMVDPYSYRDRLTMPKYIVSAAGDQFFLPDSSQFYFDDLKGEKYLRYVPNTNHSLANSDARDSALAYYQAIIAGTPRPKFTWKFEKDGAIKVQTTTKPTEVRLWQATNPKARDFRLETIGPAYTSTLLQETTPGVYAAKPDKPAVGYTAYFIELTYPGPTTHPFKFTTGVRVTPDTLPYPAFPCARCSR